MEESLLLRNEPQLLSHSTTNDDASTTTTNFEGKKPLSAAPLLLSAWITGTQTSRSSHPSLVVDDHDNQPEPEPDLSDASSILTGATATSCSGSTFQLTTPLRYPRGPAHQQGRSSGTAAGDDVRIEVQLAAETGGPGLAMAIPPAARLSGLGVQPGG
ncbi:hypothetical protein VTK56DRAFT_6048 [Thermocarpiscus australiensis]